MYNGLKMIWTKIIIIRLTIKEATKSVFLV